jgi:ABC-type Fe3+ transport system substrate-binding protein
MRGRSRVRRAPWLAGLLLVGLLLLGCGSGAGSSSAPAAPAGSKPQAGSAPAQPTQRTVAQIAALNGPDRQAILEEGAKREGALLWYTTLIVNQAVRPIVEAFNQKYPYVKVDHYRADSGDLVQRFTNEYQARRYEVDLIDGTTSPPMVKAAGWLEKYDSPYLAPYPKEMREPEGYWGTSNLYFMTAGINTRLVPKEEAPKTYEDLLNPRWRGQMGWSTSVGAGGPTFVGNILQTMGQERGMAYLEQLSKQGIRNIGASGRAVLDQAIAGEFPVALQIFNHHTVISAQQGAPSDWIPLEPVPALLQVVGLAKNAPHPHAAMLFLDFLFSEDGQRVLQQVDYLPAHPNVPAKVPSLKPEQGGYRANFISPDETLRQESEWNGIFRRLFLQPG